MGFKNLTIYHDAELVGVSSATKSGELHLSFLLDDGANKRLFLSGCEFFRIIDYTSQNIVSRILILQGVSNDSAFIEERLLWAASLSDSPSFLSSERCGHLIREIAESKKLLFLLEPSAGAEVVAFCENIAEE